MINVPKHIVSGCVQNNRSDQHKLFTLTSNYVYGIVLRYVKDADYAQDILQEVFIKVFANIDKYRPNEAAITTWMYPIAVRCSINHLRKKHNYFLDIDTPSIPVSATENIGLERLDAEYIHELILRLPDIQRIIFNMYVVEGYSHKDISEQLDIPVTTSRSYLSRAKTSLKNALETNAFKMRRS